MTYDVIYADPAWAYADHNTGGSFHSGSGNHYTTMKPSTVAKMRVKDILEDNAVCFLWVTTPLLPECFPVLNAWGFEYKTMITWYKKDPDHRVKFRLGMGRYFRGMTEHCMVGVRGDIKPFGCQMQNVIVEKPRGHSQKPVGVINLINSALMSHKMDRRIELFCRGEPPITPRIMDDNLLWDGWGNQCTGQRKVELDILPPP